MNSTNSGDRPKRGGRYVSSPETEAKVEAIASALRLLKPGDVLAYERLDNLDDGRRALSGRARRIVQRERGYVFETVRSVGIKRLEPEDVHAVGIAHRRSIVRGVVRTRTTLVLALKLDGREMSRTDRRKVTSELSRLGIIEEIAGED